MDREKVIKGLEHCTSFDDGRDKFGGVGKCGGCPYYGHDCTGRLKKDALALLKEQEAVKPITEDYMYKCGDCKWSFFSMNSTNILSMMQAVKFCPHCGKPVLWERR